jgi:hypothetical protein
VLCPNIPIIKNTKKIIINKKNNTLAILVAVDAMPRKPNKPATIAITKNMSAHCNIAISLIKNFHDDSLVTERV